MNLIIEIKDAFKNDFFSLTNIEFEKTYALLWNHPTLTDPLSLYNKESTFQYLISSPGSGCPMFPPT